MKSSSSWKRENNTVKPNVEITLEGVLEDLGKDNQNSYKSV